jgi:hypothetical protein
MSDAKDDAVVSRVDQPINSSRGDARPTSSTGDGTTPVLLAAGVVAGPTSPGSSFASASTRSKAPTPT